MRSVEEIERDWEELCQSGRRRKEVRPRGERFGDIAREAYIGEDGGKDADYVKVIQRIEDEGGGNPWVRFTYYIKRPGWSSWKLAGQTSLMLALEDFEELLRRAQKKGVFRPGSTDCASLHPQG